MSQELIDYGLCEKVFTFLELQEMGTKYLIQQYLGRGGIFAIKSTKRCIAVFATRDEKILPRAVNGIKIRLNVVETSTFERP